MFEDLSLIMFPNATREQCDRMVGAAYLFLLSAFSGAIASVPVSMLIF